MPKPKFPINPEGPRCTNCTFRKADPRRGGLCRSCYDEKRARTITIGTKVPEDIAERVRTAQQTGDWLSLAKALEPTVKAIASGEEKASAAQSALLKHILDRAYGRVTKSQEDSKQSIGVVILPTLNTDDNAKVCPKCKEFHMTHD